MTPSLYIATPSYGGMVTTGYTWSLLGSIPVLQAAGIDAGAKYVNNGAVHVARNILTANFMASGKSHLMFIDADLSWEPNALVRLVAVSENFGLDVCCGVYPRKTDPISFPVNLPEADGGPVLHPESGMWEVRDAPTGFLLIRRSVIERMMAAYPERKCRLRENTPSEEEPYEFCLFDFYKDTNGLYLSEDFGFTRLYQGIGGRIWADPTIALTHYGTRAYGGKLLDLIDRGDSPKEK